VSEEVRQGRTIKIKPSVLKRAHVSAILSGKGVGRWVEEAIEEKLAREERETAKILKRLVTTDTSRMI